MIETLTEYQRLNLLNQYKILRDLAEMRQDERTAQYYEELATIVAEGYLDSYDQLTQELNEEFPKEDCKLVWDTLRLYSAIYYSFNRLKNPKIKEADFHFDGFDGNNEFRYYHLLPFNEMISILLTVYILMGIGIGAIGSAISMKKYLEV